MSAKVGSITNCTIVAMMILVCSFAFGIIPLFTKKIKKAGTAFAMINMLISGLNLGNICYDMIPEMTGTCDVNRRPCGAIGLVIIMLIIIESIFVKDHSHSHSHTHEQHSHSTHKEKEHADKNENHVVNSSITKKEDHNGSFLSKISQTESCDSFTCVNKKDKKKKICKDHALEESTDDFQQSHFAYLNETENIFGILTFIGAISLHSFLEGLNTTCGTVFNMHIIGLLLHKSAEALAVGLALFSSKIKKHIALGIFIVFTTLTPISIYIGRATISKYKEIELYFKALALGSLMYVVFFEGVAHGMHGKHKLPKICALLGGYLTSVLFIELAHGGGEHHHHHH
ncbi:ZIP plasma membrane transporter [Ecytonucleospora hepatopenaei]|uniref:ZIP plasma membrane transporter n=1 Tax=Ecytonucleospora hepatopenaei TaxID=646526 RepID=A0A1W0E8E3_9MICR|nr:ZIP plasma membrane transporter [Ecytonucleospora hepatopenaei]